MKLVSSIFVNRNFAPLFWVQFSGALNDNIIKNILVIVLVYKQIEIYGIPGDQLTALAGGLFILPYVLFSPFAGLLADSYCKITVMRWTKAWELLISLCAIYGFYNENYLVLLFCLFMTGTQSTFFSPIKYGLIPSVVPEKNLSAANSFIEFGTFVAILTGTILGGIIAKVDLWTLSSGALIFVSLIGLAISFVQRPLPRPEANISIGFKVFSGHTRLLKVVIKNKKIFRAILAISMFWFLGAGYLTLLPEYCKNFLFVNEDVVTLFLAIFTLGIGFGSILCGKLSGESIKTKWVPRANFFMFIFLLDFYLASLQYLPPTQTNPIGISEFIAQKYSLRLLFDFFFICFSCGFFIVPLYSYIQYLSPKKTISRMIAANNIINAIFMVLASILLLVGFSLKVGVTHLYLLIGTLSFLSSGFLFLSKDSTDLKTPGN